MMWMNRYSSKIIKIPKVCSKLCGRLDKLQFTIALYLLELTVKEHPSLFSLDIFDLSYSFKQTARKINH